MDLLGQMGEMQKRMEDIQNRLDNIQVTGEMDGGAVKVTMTGNRKVLNVELADELIAEGDKERIEDLLTAAFNRASEKAANVAEAESAAAYRDLLPGMPGLGL